MTSPAMSDQESSFAGVFGEVCEPRIREILDQYRKAKGDLAPPMDPIQLASICNCRVQIVPERGSHEGVLIRSRGGFIIQHRRDLHETRKNLTICHEIAHTFFFDSSSPIPRRVRQHRQEESLCFSVARRLLVPEEPLHKMFESLWSREQPLASLARLSNVFTCSLEIMADRLTTDTSLLRDELITFWRVKNATGAKKHAETTRSFNYSYEHFRKESRLSPELAVVFPPYQRSKHLYGQVWSELVDRLLKGENPEPATMELQWKRRVEGRMRQERIPVCVDARLWAKEPSQIRLSSLDNFGFYGVISVVRRLES